MSLALGAISGLASAAGSWSSFSTFPAFDAGASLLLTDGSVMCQDGGTANWWKLTPTTGGDYSHGTWSKLPPMPNGYAPLYFASAVLSDGRVVIVGGEYLNFNATWTNKGAVYDPVANQWTPLTGPWSQVGDAQCVVLPDGRFMLGHITDGDSAILDPGTLTWTHVGTGHQDRFDEEGWTLMPDGTVLTVDAKSAPKSETFDPLTGKWNYVGDTTARLEDPNSQEIGPQVLMADGRVVCFGATGHNSIYTPSGRNAGSWSALPDFPLNGSNQQLDVADGPACLLPNGKVLVAASPGLFNNDTHFFEFDGSSLTEVTAPPQADTNSSFVYSMLTLPTGQILVSSLNGPPIIYNPDGAPQASWKPQVYYYPHTVTAGGSYQATGIQFNGLSQGSSYGDDFTNATNYPLVKVTNWRTGRVSYCRTWGHSSMGVATGSTRVSTHFDLPQLIDDGPANLQVVANGIASPPVRVEVSSFNIRSIAPGFGLIGSGATTVLITGNGFDGSSVVSAGSTPLTSSLVDNHTISVTIPADSFAVAQNLSLSVSNWSGTTSNAVTFAVRNPVPVGTFLDTIAIPKGASDTVVTLTGSNLLPSTHLYIGAKRLNTVFVSPTSIQAVIPASLLNADVTYQLYAGTPGPGGGNSTSFPIVVGGGSPR